jgi:hypothetical protein
MSLDTAKGEWTQRLVDCVADIDGGACHYLLSASTKAPQRHVIVLKTTAVNLARA